MTGLGEAWLLKAISTYSFLGVSKTLISLTILPESRSMHSAERVLPSAGAVVSQTCLPRMTGDDQPLLGMAVFQTMFSSFLSSHFSGRPVALETPEPLGPRNWVQSSAETGTASRSSDSSGRNRMGTSGHRLEGRSAGVPGRPSRVGRQRAGLSLSERAFLASIRWT